MITLLGLIANMLAMCIVVWYDTTFKEVLPTWLYVLYVVALFIYQTFDAIDGKQARRTGSSGPLGQLFDHGCDAITNSVALVGFAQSMMVFSADDGDPSAFFFFYLSSHVSACSEVQFF